MARRPLEGLRLSVTRSLINALQDCADIVEDKIRENISLDDHTLDELARLGYPYARRNPQNIHTPNYQVHRQSGRLEAALKQKKINQYTIDVGVDDTEAPEVKHILYGTSKMVARGFIRGSYNQVHSDLTEVMERALKQGVDKA